MVNVIHFRSLPESLYIKLGSVQAPCVLIGPQHFERFEDLSFVTMKSDKEDMLVKVFHHKAIEDISIIDNSCIPHLPEDAEIKLAPQPNLYTPECITFFVEKMKGLKNFPIKHIDDLKTMIKQEILFKPIYLSENSVLYVRFMDERWRLVIKHIKFYNGQPKPTKPYCISMKSYITEMYFDTKSSIPTSVRLNFGHFAGFDNQITELRNSINSAFGANPPKKMIGLLVCGDSWCGKTFLGRILESVYEEKFIRRVPHSVKRLEQLGAALIKDFKTAAERSPCILFLDELDKYCLNRADSKTVQLMNVLLDLLDGAGNVDLSGVVVIGISKQPNKLDPAIRRPGRLSKDIQFPLPSAGERNKIATELIRLSPISQEDKKIIVQVLETKAHGYNGGDLQAVLSKVLSMKGSSKTYLARINSALQSVKPKGLKNLQTQEKINFDSIVGYDDVKAALLSDVDITLKYPDAMRKVGLASTTKFLLFGPPGCGKSMLVHAISERFNLAIIPVRRSDIFAKHFGETEKNMMNIFNKAKKSAPCIIHFEHFDGLVSTAAKQGHSFAEYRLINQIKTVLDGIIELDSVFVIAETDRPDLLDKDVIRHGRIHEYFHVKLPTDDDRKQMIDRVIKDIDEPSLKKIIHHTKGYTMSQVKQFCEDVYNRLRLRSSDDNNLKSILEIINFGDVTLTSDGLLQNCEKFAHMYCLD